MSAGKNCPSQVSFELGFKLLSSILGESVIDVAVEVKPEPTTEGEEITYQTYNVTTERIPRNSTLVIDKIDDPTVSLTSISKDYEVSIDFSEAFLPIESLQSLKEPGNLGVSISPVEGQEIKDVGFSW